MKDLEHLRELKCLKNLDLENNEVTKAAGYKDAVWKMIPSLEILDNHNREGEVMLSESDEEDDSTQKLIKKISKLVLNH